MRPSTSRSHRAALALALLAPLLARAAAAAPPQFVPVGDPIEAELRVLDLFAAHGGLVAPHLNALPLQALELAADSSEAWPASGPRALALTRVRRALQRDGLAAATAGVPRSTPRVLQSAWPGEQRFELSAGLEGERDATRANGATDSRWADGSGVHVRTGVQVDRWLVYSHLFFGELRGVRAFSDALVANSDLSVSSEESYLAHTGANWSLQLGRSRWAWGPGEEATLLLSRTSAPLNGLMLHGRLAGLHADGFVFDATVDPGTGQQLAAHRIEWQPRERLRLGVSEAARYHAGGWQGLYLAGVLPYSIVQRLLDQDHPDTSGASHNNVMVGLDASVRVAEGSRAYAELLLDDVHARTAAVPNKYGWQLGWDGAGEALGRRLTWNVEATRLTRYVYTSAAGLTYAAQGRPLGYPTGPDARRLRARVSADFPHDVQLSVIAARTDKGANDLAEPFVIGTPVPPVGTLEGVVERTRTLELGARWWPASGVDVSLRAGREWVTNAGHASGASGNAWLGSFAFQLTR